MREILDKLVSWWESNDAVGLATVVSTSHSAPREPGAALVVGPGGTVYGSVSGGCVEGAVYELAREVTEDGDPVLEHYGYSDSDAFAVGLTCGGELDVYVERITQESFPELLEVADDIRNGRPVAIATVIDHPQRTLRGRRRIIRPETGQSTGTLGSARIDAAVTDDALGLLASSQNQVLTYGADGQRLDAGLRVFVQSFAPRPRLLVFGAIDFAAAVAKVGAFLGYRVTVCDARPVFATRSRFPDADEVVVEWPHEYLARQHAEGRLNERTVITVLTHDPKFDVPLLGVALGVPAAYIGAMGSRRTHEDRIDRLLAAGVPRDSLDRLSSPIGLDIGGRTPEETAISIAAEIIAARWNGTGEPLRNTVGAIHHNQQRAEL